MKINIFLLFALLLSSCAATRQAAPELNIAKEGTQGVLWQQYSGEYKALCFQAFNLAKLRLEQQLALKPLGQGGNKPMAIVTDIDETLVDNSYYHAHLIQNNLTNERANWVAWTNLSKATALPGAVDFLKWVDSKGIYIWYVTNRDSTERESTLKNLQALDFPQSLTTHFSARLPGSGGSKESRRQEIRKQYDIALLLGDNLGDFFEAGDTSIVQRNKKVLDQPNAFGETYIVLPNPVYGSWEIEKFPDNNAKPSRTAVDSLRMLKLKGY